MFQSKTMRRIHLESISRRRRWSLRFGLFLVYILVQYVTCAKIPEEVTSPYPSSTDREENWTLDSTSESFTPETEASVEPKPKAKEEAVSEKEKNERTEPKNEKNRTEEKNEGQQKHGKKTPEEEKSKLGEHSKERNAASTEKASPAEKTAPKKEVTTANVPGTTTVSQDFYYRILFSIAVFF